MIPNLPIYLSIVFGLTAIAALLIFHWVLNSSLTSSSKKVTLILFAQLGWLIFQGTLALKEVYNTNLKMLPPRLLILGILPPLFLIIGLFLSKAGRVFIDSLPVEKLIFVNVVRIPVEIGLFCLYLNAAVPQLMTFEGGNLDIISGITAPIVAYFAFTKRFLNRKILLAWNFLCLAFLLNIVARALLSAPFPFQKLAFDQPNIAILNFPFVWLPTYIVPLVLFGHLVFIRRLLNPARLQP